MFRDCLLGDLLELKRGYDLPAQARGAGSIPIVSSSGISGTHSEAKVKGPGVVTGRYGTLGEVHFIASDFWPLNTTLYVRDFKGNDARFISYFLKTLDFASRSSAAAVPGVNRNDLHRMRTRCPDLAEQRRIASILSAYDDLIENNTRRIAILEDMARRIYEEWFVRFRFPGHENVQMVESEQGPIPEGWSIRSLESLCSRITDGSHSSPVTVPSGKPMASVKDMGDWCINLSTCRQISDADYEDLVRNGCRPIAGDILIAKDGNTNLKYMLVADGERDLVLLSSVAILRPHDKDLSDLLCTYLKLPYVKERLSGFVSGAAIPRVILKISVAF